MAVVFDAKTASFTEGNGVATISISNMTVGSGANSALLCLVWFSGTDALPAGLTVVWDNGGTNQSMTQVVSTNFGDSNINAGGAIFGLVAPTSGNKTLKITWTGNQEVHACAVSFTGVNQTGGATSFAHGNTNTASANTGTITVTSATGNMVVAGDTNNQTGWGAISGTTIATTTTGPNLGCVGSYTAGAASVVSTFANSPATSCIYEAFGCDVEAS